MFQTLYRGTSYHQLRVWTYPKAPTVEVLLSKRVFNFPFVNDPLSALLMGVEQSEKDNSPISIVIAKNLSTYVEDGPETNGTYKNSYHLNFEELKNSQMKILLEDKNLNKLTEYCDFLTSEKISALIKHARKASKTMQEKVPREIKLAHGMEFMFKEYISNYE